MTGINGNITKISNIPHSCPKRSFPINFNNAGPKGEKGEVGPAGAVGPQGVKGDKGDPGTNSDGASSSSPILYANSGGEKFPVIYMLYGFYVRANGSIWRLKEVPTDELWIATAETGAAELWSDKTVDEILIYQDQSCQGLVYGYLSPGRVGQEFNEAGDLVFGNSSSTGLFFEDVAVMLAYTDQAYKRHSSSLQLSDFQSWKDSEGCHVGTPSERFMLGDQLNPPRAWEIWQLTPVDTPVNLFDFRFTFE